MRGLLNGDEHYKRLFWPCEHPYVCTSSICYFDLFLDLLLLAIKSYLSELLFIKGRPDDLLSIPALQSLWVELLERSSCLNDDLLDLAIVCLISCVLGEELAPLATHVLVSKEID